MLYDIRGVIIQPFNHNVLFDGQGLEYNKRDKSLTGRLSDVYGSSSIKGFLDLNDGLMKFDKRYDNGKVTIVNSLRRGLLLWKGGFGWKDSSRGEIQCELVEKGLKFEVGLNAHLHAQMSIGGGGNE